MADQREEGDSTRFATAQATWTIEELATATATTVRNIRAHQSRGLLPPPIVNGRVGYYGPEHVERLDLIRSMQADGFNLSAIRSMLAAGVETAERVRRLNAPVLDALDVGPHAELSPTGLSILEENHEDLDALVEAGVLRRLSGGRYAAATPAMLVAARLLLAAGIEGESFVVAMHDLVSVAQTAAESVATVTHRLCGGETDSEKLAQARAWVTEIVRAVLDRSLGERLAPSHVQ